MRTTTLYLDMLIVPPGLRALNENTIVGLMKSFQDIGMQTPVTYYDNDDGDAVLVSDASEGLLDAIVSEHYPDHERAG